MNIVCLRLLNRSVGLNNSNNCITFASFPHIVHLLVSRCWCSVTFTSFILNCLAMYTLTYCKSSCLRLWLSTRFSIIKQFALVLDRWMCEFWSILPYVRGYLTRFSAYLVIYSVKFPLAYLTTFTVVCWSFQLLIITFKSEKCVNKRTSFWFCRSYFNQREEQAVEKVLVWMDPNI